MECDDKTRTHSIRTLHKHIVHTELKYMIGCWVLCEVFDDKWVGVMSLN